MFCIFYCRYNRHRRKKMTSFVLADAPNQIRKSGLDGFSTALISIQQTISAVQTRNDNYEVYLLQY